MTRTFGEQLGELLLLRGWSAARLSRALNTDSSYVRRWIRGDRVPSLQSPYVMQIAEVLTAGIELKGNGILDGMTARLQEWDEGLEQSSIPVQQRIAEALKKSQVYSLQLPEAERRPVKPESGRDVSYFLEDFSVLNNRRVEEERNPVASEVAQIPAVINGRAAILNAMVTLIETAVSRNAGEVMVTFQSEKDDFEEEEALYRYWKSGISKLLLEGWTVRTLWRLNKDVSRSFRIVKDIVAYAGHGRNFQPRYAAKYGAVVPPFELFVIPGTGAMHLFAANSPNKADTAFFYTDNKAVDALASYFRQLSVQSEPLIHIMGQNDYFIKNTLKDRRTDELLYFGRDLSPLTLPMPLWERYLARSFDDPEELERHAGRIRSRLELFRQKVKAFPVRHICSKQAIEHLLQTGRYLVPNPYRRPEGEDAAGHIRHLIELLTSLEHFELALVDEEKFPAGSLFWEVKGEHTVMLIAPGDREDNELAIECLAIEENTIAGAFRDHFMELWAEIPPRQRDKAFVLEWLEGRMRSLR